MRLRIFGTIGLVAALALALMPVAGATTAAANTARTARSVEAAGSVRSVGSVQSSLNAGVAQARANGVTTYAAVLDRSSGAVVARTSNAGTQVASESLVKMFLAAYYLVEYQGHLPLDLGRRLRYMIVYSDDGTASALWSNAAVPQVSTRYGLSGIAPATPNAGYWGRTKITADAIAMFLYRAGKDPVVGPWLFSAMGATADVGSDGYNQNLGFNRIAGVGSKQGWGHDNWTNGSSAVHSAGVGARYVAAVLQSGGSGSYDRMPGLATNTAGLIDRAVNTVAHTPVTSITSSYPVTRPNSAIIIRAHPATIGRTLPGLAVRFYSRTADSAWTYRRVMLTDHFGNVGFVTSSGTQGQAWKAVVPAQFGYAASESSAVIVAVQSPVALAPLPTIVPRHSVQVMRGTTSPAYAGSIVRAVHQVWNGWATDARGAVGADGTFRFYFRVGVPGYYRVTIDPKAGSYQAATWSSTVRVLVR